MLTNGMSRAIAVVLGLTLAVAALVSVSAQGGPPHYYYGTDTMAGDVVELIAGGETVGTATADATGWSIQADVDPADASFTLNGAAATADIMDAGEGSSEVSLSVASEDSMGEDSMGEDSMGEDSMGEDSMGEDSMGEDAMGEGEESMLNEDNDFPGTGSGGLAGSGGISAGLIGLLIALGAVAVTGLGLRRVRNRA